MITNSVITIFHYDTENSGYIITYVGAVSLYKAVKSAPTNNGFIYDNTIKIRIPTSEDITVSTGDYVYIGTVDTMPSKNLCHKILGVGDNRKGNLPHWRIDCK